ncbi:ATP-grasp domain-containing protein [Streptomyces griseoaurantiacus]|uniref:ATP-grasp domain-containing protein n=1 Tax=Streptomyces griseoaurantiacus TaxID=68213 RepID=A0A7W2DX12_9ACTN|nr:MULTISPECIES: ATP-grasp domain-containing protein [Streptomyces]MBA5224584.1 ATP-grasp domain-containing protein [Streptomyces griseoaurantiacus]
MSAQPRRPVLAVVSGGDPAYRGYCLEAVAADNRLVLIDSTAPPGFVHDLVVDYELADVQDTEAVVRAGLALAERHEIAGVLTWNEYSLVPAAALAERLGLPGNTVASMLACRDKGTTRRLLAEAGVPSAASKRVDSPEAASHAADRIGYPVVLKPASHAASIGVIRVDRPDDLPGAWQFTASGAREQGSEGSGVLVEEYLEGPEVSVECASFAGETVALAVTRKELGFAPYFEEVGHTVTADDPLLRVVAPVARHALRALGVTEGVQHVEMRLTDSGPRIIEVNARIGGDFIGRLVHLATGLDLPAIASALATHRTPDLTATSRGSAAVRILHPPTSGTLLERRMPAHSVGAGGGELREVGWLRSVGENVTLPPQGSLYEARIGYLITTAPTLSGAEAARLAAEEAMVVRIRPKARTV